MEKQIESAAHAVTADAEQGKCRAFLQTLPKWLKTRNQQAEVQSDAPASQRAASDVDPPDEAETGAATSEEDDVAALTLDKIEATWSKELKEDAMTIHTTLLLAAAEILKAAFKVKDCGLDCVNVVAGGAVKENTYTTDSGQLPWSERRASASSLGISKATSCSSTAAIT